jgi:hypothetical protein
MAVIGELKDKVQLPEDDPRDTSFFVLGMTVCGEEWTVEYGARYQHNRVGAGEPLDPRTLSVWLVVEPQTRPELQWFLVVSLRHHPQWELGEGPLSLLECSGRST